VQRQSNPVAVGQRRRPLDCFPPASSTRGSLAMTTRFRPVESNLSDAQISLDASRRAI
jgi:hypothetical protein